MLRTLVLLVGLISTLLVATPPPALAKAERGVTMARPGPARHGTVVLQGSVAGSARYVVLQRNADGRWKRVRQVAVRNHRYLATVTSRPSQQRFRVRAGSQTSQIRLIPAARPTATKDACGVRPKKADGSRWSCTFAEDFDAVRLNRSKWAVHTALIAGPANGNYACYRDHRDNVDVVRGTLRLTVRKLDKPAACAHPRYDPSPYTAGAISTFHKFSQRYGRFEARIKVRKTDERGLQESFWMWPDNRHGTPGVWPLSGEIDIAETYSQHPDLVIPYLHYSVYAARPGVNTAYDCEAQRGVFNRFTMTWAPKRIEIFVNGKSCLVNTEGDQAFQKRYILAFTAALGLKGNKYVGDAPLPATMSVDYVRAWR